MEAPLEILIVIWPVSPAADLLRRIEGRSREETIYVGSAIHRWCFSIVKMSRSARARFPEKMESPRGAGRSMSLGILLDNNVASSLKLIQTIEIQFQRVKN